MCTFLTTADSKLHSHEVLMHSVVGRAAFCPGKCRDKKHPDRRLTFPNDTGFISHARSETLHGWDTAQARAEIARQQAKIATEGGAEWRERVIMNPSEPLQY